MGRLIDDLLEFARLGRTPVRRMVVNPGPIVHAVLDDLRTEYGEPDIQLAVSDLPLCNADPALLKQANADLVSNAFKFSNQRRHPMIDIGAEASDDGEVRYFVRD